MAIKPILFNTDMVRSILDGRKTVTRMVVKPANPFRNKEGYCQGNGLWIDGYSKDDEPNGHIKDYSVSSCWWPKRSYIEKYAPYQPGDILYVRESVFQGVGHYLDVSGETVSVLTNDFEYYADGLHEKDHWKDKYERTWMHRRPSIHMPKEAARIWLKVNDVRVERLQEISGGDLIKEGIDLIQSNYVKVAFDKFKRLWNSTIKKSDIDCYGWDANPYVWVSEFETCEKPEG